MNGFETILPFLKPIEHLILDDTVSEVMVNGPDCVFVERNGFIERASGITLGERALNVAVKNIARRLGDDISEAKPKAVGRTTWRNTWRTLFFVNAPP